MDSAITANYYELLGIGEKATSNEIKKAYYIKVRQFPNETHPKEFQLLTKAYKTLSITESKTQYDQSIQDNGSYSKLFNRAIESMENEQYQNALYSLRNMLESYPNDLEIQKHIAICYLNLNKNKMARDILLQLERNHPKDELILSLLGRAFLTSSMYIQAKEYYKKLILINPDEINYFIFLSRAYANLGEHDQALRVIEDKLNRKRVSVYDFPLFEELFIISMVADKKSYHQNIIDRIKKLPATIEEKNILLDMLMDLCESVDNKNNSFKELVYLVKDINAYQNHAINEWLKNMESNIRDDLIYYGDPIPSNFSSQNNNQSQSNQEDDGRGSVFFSIILGIITSFIFTPILGIVIGFYWYFNARSILKFLGVLICVAIVIIVIGIASLSGL